MRIRDGTGFVFIAFGVAAIASMASALVLAIAFVLVALAEGLRSPQELTEATQTPIASWSYIVASSLAMMCTAMLACVVLRAPIRARLGLVQPAVGRAASVLLVVGTIVPFTLALLATSLVPSLVDESTNGFMRMWSEGSRGFSVLWIITIGVLPGLTEELLFRGLILRGLLLRIRPFWAILISSALFGFMHLEPAHVVFAFVIGLWLGTVAWRTKSVVLPILMHASLNGSWTVVQMFLHRTQPSQELVDIAAATIVGTGLISLIAALLLMRRQPESVDPSWRLAPRALVLAGLIVLLAGALWMVIPPATRDADQALAKAPTKAQMVEQLVDTLTLDNLEEEITFSVPKGGSVLVELPENRLGLSDAIIALNESGSVLWLCYQDDISGKKVGKGVFEQLRAGDPMALVIEFERETSSSPSGLSMKLRIVEDQAESDDIRTRIDGEQGWAIRGRK